MSLLLLFRPSASTAGPVVLVTGMFDEPSPSSTGYDEPSPTAATYDEPTPSASMYDNPSPS